MRLRPLALAGKPAAKVTGRVLTAGKMDAVNSFAQPQAVQPVAFNAQAQGGKLTVSVPAKAVVVVAVELKIQPVPPGNRRADALYAGILPYISPFLLAEMQAAQNPDTRKGLVDFDKALFGHILFTIRHCFRAFWIGISGSNFVKVPHKIGRAHV